MKVYWLITFALLCSPAFSIGELSRKKIYQNETAQITFSFRSSSLDVKIISIPTVPGLQIAGPSTSQQHTNINGKQSSVISKIFQIIPKKAGRFTIPPLVVEVAGKQYASPKQRLVVRKGNSPYIGGTTQKYQKRGLAKGRLVITNNRPYQGELVGAYYKIGVKNFARPNVQLSTQEIFDFKTLFAEPYTHKSQEPIKPFAGYETIAWEQRYLLVPLKAGNTIIDSHRLGEAVDRARVASSATVTIPAVTIRTRPLPARGKPVNFSGNIGYFNYKIDTQPVERGQYQQGGSLMVRLTVTGRGNFIHFSAPAIQHDDANFQFLEQDETTREYAKDPANPTGKVVVEYKLLATAQGQLSPGGFRFTAFNPYKRKYETEEQNLTAVLFTAAPKGAGKKSGSKEWPISLTVIILIAVGVLGIGGIAFFRKPIAAWKPVRTQLDRAQAVRTQVSHRLNAAERARAANRDVADRLQKICGRKSGLLCEEYLTSRGIGYREIKAYQDMMRRLDSSDLAKVKVAMFTPAEQAMIDRLVKKTS